MSFQYYCGKPRRRAAVRAANESSSNPLLNGIDYLEVANSEQTELAVYFLAAAPAELKRENIAIRGGTRVKNIQVIDAKKDRDNSKLLRVTVNTRGDFSTYSLQLVKSSTSDSSTNDNLPKTNPPLDPRLAEVNFSFKASCPSEFDCPQPPDCAPPSLPIPQIDYLAKDYASFRQLMLDRLSVTLPDWQERNPADVGIAIVEVLAYAADRLSYYQDAVATEAYLGTARQRTSVRRHTRLLGYSLHEGCNARTWVQVKTSQENWELPAETPFLTQVLGQPTALEPNSEDYQKALRQNPTIFESLHSQRLFPGQNEIQFYTWSDDNCCLPKGATKATFREKENERLCLRVGDVVILAETRSPETGEPEDADPTHRWAVRLTSVKPEAKVDEETGVRTPDSIKEDPLTKIPVVEVEWHSEDALPFPLCLSKEVEGKNLTNMAVAYGNLVLADHGRTVEDASLQPAAVSTEHYRPTLPERDITYRVPYPTTSLSEHPASQSWHQDPREALPVVRLTDEQGQNWQPLQELLNSDRFDQRFVVEMSSERIAKLRFGDGIQGQAPAPGTRFRVTYRIGNGRAGNVGAEAIAHIVTTSGRDIRSVTNPLPGMGGTEPEPMTQAKLDAPQAFRVQQRAVTADDYAAAAKRHPEVQKAQATRRWTGSWYTWFLTVDRKGGLPVDEAFEQDLRQHLEQFRLAGYDLEVDAPQYVPLDIVLGVCLKPGFYPGPVKASLLEVFSNRDLPNGQRGVFHPDNFTFGQSVYLSKIVAKAMSVPGVQWVDFSSDKLHRFQRWGRSANNELANGEISCSRLEIVRLDNDPNRPENGRIDFLMEGGR